ncbi:MAG: hypothetical protein ACOZAM_30180 [Pseudomonadota bacterium]
MTAAVPIDPLETAYLLAAEISGADRTPADITRLIRTLDALAYAVHFAEAEGTASELEPPRLDYAQTYDSIRQRYPFLGRYWLALHPVLQEGTEGELAVGDAIDDLADILSELKDVRWLHERAGRKEALGALRERYDMHLWMHIHSLRQYLEEVKRDD